MDNIEATKFIPYGIELSQADNDQILKQESATFTGDTNSIKAYIAKTYPELYKSDHKRLDRHISNTPAGAIETAREPGKSTFETFVNTDNVTDAELIPVLKRHEAIEVLMSDKYLDTNRVAQQIGIDEEIIINDMGDDTHHYVAMYYELLLAQSMGILEKHLDFRHQAARQSTRDLYRSMSLPKWKRFLQPKWKQKFKSRARSKSESIFLVPKMIAEKIKSEL